MNAKENIKAGLTSHEAEARLQKIGPNILKTRFQSPALVIFLRQFKSTLIVILIAAAALATAMEEYIDAAAVSAIVFLNGLFGFVQEWRAERTLEALHAILSNKARVRRDGIEQEIDTRYVVPGDCVIIEAGDKIPADINLTNSLSLRIDESILTGESKSVKKQAQSDLNEQEPLSSAYMGTNAVYGRGEGIVTQTGMSTRFGKIAALTGGVRTKSTHLQKKLGKLGQRIGLLALFLALIIVIVGWLNGKLIDEMVLTALSLAVALVPEGLPAVVTVTLALGARAMVKRNTLSRRLQATETLGAASVICTDKTGTLTKNEMTVSRIWAENDFFMLTGTGYDPAGHFEKDGVWTKIGDPTEVSLIVAAYKAWLDIPDRSHIMREIPFSSERKRMSILARDGETLTVHCKGAPDVILSHCTKFSSSNGENDLDDFARQNIRSAYQEMASMGLRVLAIACKKVSEPIFDDEMEEDLTFLGFIGIIDPPRPEVKAVIAQAREAGIKS